MRYPVTLTPDENGTIIAQAVDAPITLFVHLIAEDQPIPRPSRPRRGQPVALLPAQVTAKLAIYEAMRVPGLTHAALESLRDDPAVNMPEAYADRLRPAEACSSEARELRNRVWTRLNAWPRPEPALPGATCRFWRCEPVLARVWRCEPVLALRDGFFSVVLGLDPRTQPGCSDHVRARQEQRNRPTPLRRTRPAAATPAVTGRRPRASEHIMRLGLPA